MTNTICGHERDVLFSALREWVEFPDVAHGMAYLAPELRGVNYDDAEWSAARDANDPAKLAEMLTEEGRRLGFGDMAVLPGLSSIQNYPKAVIWLHCDLVAVEIGTYHGGPMRMPQARAILLQWLQLPDGAHEEALWVLRGKT